MVSPKMRVSLLVAGEMRAFDEARAGGLTDCAWRSLERAHILAQPFVIMHLASHLYMLRFAIALGDNREAFGQLFRLALAPLGALTSRIPIGNTGRARVSAFLSMAIPDDLKQAMRDTGIAKDI